jgi:Fe-S-cluster containining protein
MIEPVIYSPRMTPSLTDTLCTRCGLCCDGSLFADVELVGRREATRLEILGLAIEDDDADGQLLLLPCAALQGRRCGIYAHRPSCCRRFECRLLQEVRRGTVTVERAAERIADALKRIARVRTLLAELGERDDRLPLNERCAEALAEESGATEERNRKRAELEAAMSAVERLIRKTFLGGEGRGSLDRRGRPPAGGSPISG